MALDTELYLQHSDGLLARTLRADPDFVSCPRCKGGGFMTPKCLGERQKEREAAIAAHGKCVNAIIAIFLVGAVAAMVAFWMKDVPIWASALGWVGFSLLAEILHRSSRARLGRIQWGPLDVSCPDCEANFSHDSHGRSAGGPGPVERDPMTDQWLLDHSRPCPRCRVPITKEGGCNHMQCQKCKLHFCWACMRESTTCGSYKCNNGAPFGNASCLVPTQSNSERGHVSCLRLAGTMTSCFACAEAASRQQMIFILPNLGKVVGIVIFFLLGCSFFLFLIFCLCAALARCRECWRRRQPGYTSCAVGEGNLAIPRRQPGSGRANTTAAIPFATTEASAPVRWWRAALARVDPSSWRTG